MPTNLYGVGDNFDLSSSHVVPALIRKAYEAKFSTAPEMVIWGSGTPRREFLHVDDAADALVYLITHYSGDTHVNVGFGSDVSILELAKLIARVHISIDSSKPDGTPRKLLDSSKLTSLGWQPRIGLEEGLRNTYQWFTESGSPQRADDGLRRVK